MAQDKNGQTPLHLASRGTRVEVACMLIERGADVMAQDKDGRLLYTWRHEGTS
jgi:ankyrin repeat protein